MFKFHIKRNRIVGRVLLTCLIYVSHLFCFHALIANSQGLKKEAANKFFITQNKNKQPSADYWLLLVKHNLEKDVAKNLQTALGNFHQPLLIYNELPAVPISCTVNPVTVTLSANLFKRYCILQVFRI